MKLNVYAVYDAKMQLFGIPFFQAKDNVAIRDFGDAVNDKSPNNMWNKHPEDYSLFRIGTYENENGILLSELPLSLITASALMAINGDLSTKDLIDEVEKAKLNSLKKKEPVK